MGWFVLPLILELLAFNWAAPVDLLANKDILDNVSDKTITFAGEAEKPWSNLSSLSEIVKENIHKASGDISELILEVRKDNKKENNSSYVADQPSSTDNFKANIFPITSQNPLEESTIYVHVLQGTENYIHNNELQPVHIFFNNTLQHIASSKEIDFAVSNASQESDNLYNNIAATLANKTISDSSTTSEQLEDEVEVLEKKTITEHSLDLSPALNASNTDLLFQQRDYITEPNTGEFKSDITTSEVPSGLEIFLNQSQKVFQQITENVEVLQPASTTEQAAIHQETQDDVTSGSSSNLIEIFNRTAKASAELSLYSHINDDKTEIPVETTEIKNVEKISSEILHEKQATDFLTNQEIEGGKIMETTRKELLPSMLNMLNETLDLKQTVVSLVNQIADISQVVGKPAEEVINNSSREYSSNMDGLKNITETEVPTDLIAEEISLRNPILKQAVDYFGNETGSRLGLIPEKLPHETFTTTENGNKIVDQGSHPRDLTDVKYSEVELNLDDAFNITNMKDTTKQSVTTDASFMEVKNADGSNIHQNFEITLQSLGTDPEFYAAQATVENADEIPMKHLPDRQEKIEVVTTTKMTIQKLPNLKEMTQIVGKTIDDNQNKQQNIKTLDFWENFITENLPNDKYKQKVYPASTTEGEFQSISTTQEPEVTTYFDTTRIYEETTKTQEDDPEPEVVTSKNLHLENKELLNTQRSSSTYNENNIFETDNAKGNDAINNKFYTAEESTTISHIKHKNSTDDYIMETTTSPLNKLTNTLSTLLDQEISNQEEKHYTTEGSKQWETTTASTIYSDGLNTLSPLGGTTNLLQQQFKKFGNKSKLDFNKFTVSEAEHQTQGKFTPFKNIVDETTVESTTLPMSLNEQATNVNFANKTNLTIFDPKETHRSAISKNVADSVIADSEGSSTGIAAILLKAKEIGADNLEDITEDSSIFFTTTFPAVENVVASGKEVKVNEEVTTDRYNIKGHTVAVENILISIEEGNGEIKPTTTEYIADTTYSPTLARVPLQKDINNTSLKITELPVTNAPAQNLKMHDVNKTYSGPASTIQTAEPIEKTTTLSSLEYSAKEIVPFIEYTDSKRNIQPAKKEDEEHSATSHILVQETLTKANFMVDQKQEIGSTTEHDTQTDAGSTQTATAQQTTESEIYATTLVEDNETTVTPAEPPPKLEYLQSADGVEVFYGYSIVKHN